jgi:hypothetical protein
MMRGNRAKKANPTRKAQRKALSPTHPPSIGSYGITHTTRLRFTSNAAFSGNITFQNLLDAIVLAQSALNLYDLFHTVKVRRVQVWAIPAQGTTTSVQVAFAGISTQWAGDAAVHTDTSMGIQPAYVSARPAPKSVAADFQQSATNTAFNLVCPIGSVIDVSLSFRNIPGYANLASNASVGATVGAISFRGLDGLAAATSKFVPAVGPVV